MQVIGRRPLHARDLFDRRTPEPGKVLEREEEFLVRCAVSLSESSRRVALCGMRSPRRSAAAALAEYKGGLGFWKTLRTKFVAHHPLAPDNAWAHAAVFRGRLSAIAAFDSPDSVAVAKALAALKGPLALPNLERVSPQTLAALLENEGVEIPLIETLEIIPEPDGSPTDDFVIPKGFKERQLQQRAQ